jgi:hypothetical protein
VVATVVVEAVEAWTIEVALTLEGMFPLQALKMKANIIHILNKTGIVNRGLREETAEC